MVGATAYDIVVFLVQVLGAVGAVGIAVAALTRLRTVHDRLARAALARWLVAHDAAVGQQLHQHVFPHLSKQASYWVQALRVPEEGVALVGVGTPWHGAGVGLSLKGDVGQVHARHHFAKVRALLTRQLPRRVDLGAGVVAASDLSTEMPVDHARLLVMHSIQDSTMELHDVIAADRLRHDEKVTEKSGSCRGRQGRLCPSWLSPHAGHKQNCGVTAFTMAKRAHESESSRDTLNLDCGICHSLMVDAVQTKCCGGGFCRTCLDAVLAPRRCPLCRAALTKAIIVSDPRAERLSAAKIRTCPDCAFHGNRADLDVHRRVHFDLARRCAELEAKVGELEQARVAAHCALFAACLEHAEKTNDNKAARRILRNALKLPPGSVFLLNRSEDVTFIEPMWERKWHYDVRISFANFNVSCTVDCVRDAPPAPNLRLTFLHPDHPDKKCVVSFDGWTNGNKRWTVFSVEGLTRDYEYRDRYVVIVNFV